MKAIEFKNIGKQYRLGLVSTRTLSHDLNRWWAMNVLHKDDPYLKIGETNDRSHKGHSDYVWALRDINFSVEEGDVVGIIGKNGAGKSTLLKLLSRVTSPTTGTIEVNGRIASLLEVGTGFHPEMTGRENIYLNGAILGMTKQEITRKLDEIVDFSGCERYIDTPVKRYSSGMTVRLGFAIAAHLEPEILVVDEVLAVGDAEFQKKAIGKMQDVAKGGGRTVLFVSHNMNAVRKLCKTGIVLTNGCISYQGSASDCINQYIASNSKSNTAFKKFYNEEDIDPSKEVCIVSVGFENGKNIFNTQDDINVIVELKANETVNLCRINTTLFRIDDTPIGSVSNQHLFHIKAGEKKKIRLTLKNHHLCVDNYYLSFSVGIGNFTTGQRDFDLALKAISFTIGNYSENTDESVLQWNKMGWGNIMLPYEQSIIE